MFGGFGLHCNGIFFGIIADGGVYFKTDAATVDAYKDIRYESLQTFC